MLLGKRVLGEALARAEAEKHTGQGIIAVLLGPRVLGTTESSVAVPAASVVEPVRPERTASGNRLPKRTPTKKGTGETVPSFSEDEVQALLHEDAHNWVRLLEAEGQRPDGPRPAVAALVLQAAARITDVPIPEEVLAELEVIARGPVTT